MLTLTGVHEGQSVTLTGAFLFVSIVSIYISVTCPILGCIQDFCVGGSCMKRSFDRNVEGIKKSNDSQQKIRTLRP